MSQAAYGLAMWLTALAEYAHTAGLERKMRNYVPPARPTGRQTDGNKNIWQYSTNVIDLNEEVILRTSKWSHMDPTSAANQKNRRHRQKIQ